MKSWRIGVVMGTWLTLFAAPGAGSAQESFPNHPVRIVIPYSPGSVAESKSGANGSIAAEEVARSTPDGYTWLLVTTFFSASPALDPRLRWDPMRDFIPVGQICRAPNFFTCPPHCR